MDDFSVFGSSFENYLTNLEKVLKRCKEKNLTLNWETCHFMGKKGIVLGHVISSDSIEADKAKIKLIANLPPPTCVKKLGLFLDMLDFIVDSFKILAKLLSPCAVS